MGDGLKPLEFIRILGHIQNTQQPLSVRILEVSCCKGFRRLLFFLPVVPDDFVYPFMKSVPTPYHSIPALGPVLQDNEYPQHPPKSVEGERA